MNRFIDILAALDAGKLPSHTQVNDFLEWLKTDIISDGALSTQGHNLAERLRDVITAYQILGEHKNRKLVFCGPRSAPDIVQTILSCRKRFGTCLKETYLTPLSMPRLA